MEGQEDLCRSCCSAVDQWFVLLLFFESTNQKSEVNRSEFQSTAVEIERGMSPLKFYHDFSCDAESLRLAYGPCWEPVIAQCNLAWDFVSPPSKDPSPALPVWDKLRLLLHGRLTMSVQQLTLLLHTSLDPYSTTEEMELTWTDLAMDWTNANFIFKGSYCSLVIVSSWMLSAQDD